MILTYIILAVIVILVLWAIISFNGLVRSRNRAQESWADIDVQLKRRYDLIPNLVNTVKGYAAHESSAFENVTRARAAAMGATGLADKGVAETQLAGAHNSGFAIAEAYPDLKANRDSVSLQSELTSERDKAQAARRFY